MGQGLRGLRGQGAAGAAGLVGGLGLFLFAMGLMSEGLKGMAGQKLKSLLESLTKHRVVAVLIGALVCGCGPYVLDLDHDEPQTAADFVVYAARR